MTFLICKQGLFGGTDKLLDRLYKWAKKDHQIDIVDSMNNTPDMQKKYDLAIVPSSQLDNIYCLLKHGISIERVLVWIMGMGAFSDSYYTFPPRSFFDRILKKKYAAEARETLLWLTRNAAIVFTDSVGIYNTYKAVSVEYNKNFEKNIVPIAIEVPIEIKWKKNINYVENKVIKISWLGRVSSDFKEIPLKHLIRDLREWFLTHDYKIKLIIIGEGNALEKIQAETYDVPYSVEYIKNIPYEELNDFIVNNVDLLIAQGTSAIDGAKIGCPTVVITPVRSTDPERVEYRWIYESKGYSLGEYPNLDIETDQVRHDFMTIMNEYISNDFISQYCFDYAQKFNMNCVFRDFLNRDLPEKIDKEMLKHIKKFYRLKKAKEVIKQIHRKM